MSLRINIVPNRTAKPQILLRKSWREGKRVRHKTVGNLTGLPPEMVESFRTILQGGIALDSIDDALGWKRALPHGHVAAALASARTLGLHRILDRRRHRLADLALAAIIARIIEPGSKLATARRLDSATASSSLGMMLGLGRVSGNEMLEMLDWLRSRQRCR